MKLSVKSKCVAQLCLNVPLTIWQECFGDYAPVLPSLFSINHHPTPDRPLFGSSINVWNPDALERTVQGLIGVLLSLKKKPIIRYEKMSSMAKKLGQAVQVSFSQLSQHTILMHCSNGSARKLRYSTFVQVRHLPCFSFSIEETIPSHPFSHNGHTKQWFTNSSASRMAE
jgi:hypothetical protein